RALPVAVFQRLAHPRFARALVVVPAVVEKREAAIERAADDFDAQLFGHTRQADVPASQPNCRNTLTGAAKRSVRHVELLWWHSSLPLTATRTQERSHAGPTTGASHRNRRDSGSGIRDWCEPLSRCQELRPRHLTA